MGGGNIDVMDTNEDEFCILHCVWQRHIPNHKDHGVLFRDKTWDVVPMEVHLL